jgi:hypothetical protein
MVLGPQRSDSQLFLPLTFTSIIPLPISYTDSQRGVGPISESPGEERDIGIEENQLCNMSLDVEHTRNKLCPIWKSSCSDEASRALVLYPSFREPWFIFRLSESDAGSFLQMSIGRPAPLSNAYSSAGCRDLSRAAPALYAWIVRDP